MVARFLGFVGSLSSAEQQSWFPNQNVQDPDLKYGWGVRIFLHHTSTEIYDVISSSESDTEFFLGAAKPV